MARLLRVLVAGSRGFEGNVLIKKTQELEDSYKLLAHFLDKYYKDVPIMICHGDAKHGADRLADRYAKERGLEVKLFPANWDTDGITAGLNRNTWMADFCDEAVCFWDGHSKGTLDTMNKVQRRNKKLRVYQGWEPRDYRPLKGPIRSY